MLRDSEVGPKCARSKVEVGESVQAKPKMGRFNSDRTELRINGKNPKCKKSKTSTAKPQQTKLLADKEDPEVVQSDTNKEKPNRTLLRMDKFSFAKPLGKRISPKTDNMKPIRTKPRTRGEGPRCRRSSAGKAGPSFAVLCTDIEKSKCVKSEVKGAKPSRLRPATSKVSSVHAGC